jgi:hypothetical protein
MRRHPVSAAASAFPLSEVAPTPPSDAVVAAVQPLLEHFLTNGQTETPEIVRAWDAYKSPEVRFACRTFSNAFSSAKLVLGRRTVVGRDPEPIEEPSSPSEQKAYELLQTFAGGPEGQTELLDRIGTYFTVTGDMAMVGALDPDHIKDHRFAQWDVWSTSEVRWDGRQINIRTSAVDDHWQTMPTYIKHVRVWNRHPRWGWMSDSPVLSALEVLEQIGLYDARLRADSLSRLIGSGVWMLPQGLSLPDAKGGTGGTKGFMELLMEVAKIAIKDRYSPAASIPILVEAAADDIEAAAKGHVSFSTDYADKIMDLREADIRRWATGVDLPAETVMGMAASTHWNASLISEDKVQSFIIPSLRRTVGNMTIGWLRPALEAFSVPDPSLVLWFDPAGIKTRVDLGDEAQWASERFMINDKDTRVATGLGQMKEPDNEQLKRQLLLHMAKMTPEFIPEVMRELGIPNNMPDLTRRQATTVALDQQPSIKTATTDGKQGPQEANATDKQPAQGEAGRSANLSTTGK